MKKFILIFILLSCITFTSCNSESKNTETSNGNTNTNKEILQMKSYKKTIDNVVFDTKICIGDKNAITEDSLVTTNASMVKTDSDKLYKTLFSKIELKEKLSSEGINQFGKPSTFIDFIGKDRSVLSCNSSSSIISFRNKRLIEYIDHSFKRNEMDADYNGNKYSFNKDFPFISREDAFKKIQSTLNSLGFNIDENNYIVYSLDYETLKKEEYCIGMDGNEDKSQYKESWTENDNCYYFMIRPTFKNIPEVYKYAFENRISIQNHTSPIQVVYTRDGIQYLSIDSILSINSDEKKVNLVSFDKIAETVAKHKDMLGNTSYKVTNATLAYLIDTTTASEKYPVNLVWILNIKDLNPPVPTSADMEVIVDAVTGKEASK